MQTHANTLNTWLFLGVTGHTSCVKYVNVCNMISTFQSAAVAGSKTLRKKYAVDLRNPVQAMSGFLMVPSLALSSQVYKMLRQRQLGPLLPPPWLCQTCKLYNAACDWFACGAWRKNMNRWTRKKPWTEGRHLHCRVRHQEKHSKKHPRVATWQLMASHPDSQATHWPAWPKQVRPQGCSVLIIPPLTPATSVSTLKAAASRPRNTCSTSKCLQIGCTDN